MSSCSIIEVNVTRSSVLIIERRESQAQVPCPVGSAVRTEPFRESVRTADPTKTARLAFLTLNIVLVALATSSRGAEGFRDRVAPILVKKCLGCHNDRKSAGGLNMSTFAGLRKGGDVSGELILEPGSPDDSILIESVRPGAAPRMP